MKALAGDVKKKCSYAAALLSSILNVTFLLRLTGIANSDSEYGILVKKVQEVNFVSHERLEGFELVNDKMADCVVNYNLCPVKDNKNVCYWPGVHFNDYFYIYKFM